MSSAIKIIEKANETYNLSRGISQNLKFNKQLPKPPKYRYKISGFPVLYPSPKQYCHDSEFYQIRGGFVAEVIYNPFTRFMENGILHRVINDLRRVTLRAFGKTEKQAEIYAPDQIIRKNAIFVDWLTVVRKDTKVVAYTAASFIDDDILYLHASMVLPEFQSHGGLGIVPHMYVWKKLLESKLVNRQEKFRVVGRTRNQGVVSMMSHVLEKVMISGDNSLSLEYRQIFTKTAEVLKSPYDEENGIAKNVYPKGLPNGSGKTNGEYDKLFFGLDECDAFFIAGRVDVRRMLRLLNRELVNNSYRTNQKAAEFSLLKMAA